MKTTREKPEIIRIVYRQEPGDPHYGSCLWAIFDLDPGRGMLNIQSDCGNYAYRWPERGEDFLKIFPRTTDGYLLEKLCGKPQDVDTEATIKRIREYLEEMEIPKSRRKRLIGYLESTFSEYTLDDELSLAQFLVDEWNSDYDVEIDQAWELVETDYEAWQKRIVDIFQKHVVPEIEKIIEERESDGTDDKD